ncbi:hypothetical protein JRO89_XS11G0027800 [Xanthoceras sorbifolium]|uniref:Eukaryotic translation initiation factor 3 subunit J n=1 Tax=Xanthoceras sorbifolium TaxID=99658 RepID=A0ABQ8HEF1_9ROSI|nr:hypothetical protein JRO89_XS11G0027800 [Xanthoceras sorbifolium]
MEDWEDERIPPLILKEQPKNNWDDEDVDEDDVKESWEDEDEPAPAAPTQPLVQPPEKSTNKPAAKPPAKKGKPVEVAKEEPLDPLAEKLRQQRSGVELSKLVLPQAWFDEIELLFAIVGLLLKTFVLSNRLVEEADYKATKELFGKRVDEKSLDNFIPKSESDFLEYAELISHKLRPYEKSFHYISLLKAVMRLSMTSLKAADAKDVASSITAIANEKLKAEKEAAAGKKKTGGKKKQLHVDKPDDDLAVGQYDALDDYDFM